MLNLPVMRWGKPYESLETVELSHLLTGEPVAKVGQINGGIVQRDLRKASTQNQSFITQLGDSTPIDRLNIGPIATNRLNWLQPHEGNIIDFLYRSRAY